MYKIIAKQGSKYADIGGTREETKNIGFSAYARSKVSVSYDLRTNESKAQKIKMREIRNDGKE